MSALWQLPCRRHLLPHWRLLLICGFEKLRQCESKCAVKAKIKEDQLNLYRQSFPTPRHPSCVSASVFPATSRASSSFLLAVDLRKNTSASLLMEGKRRRLPVIEHKPPTDSSFRWHKKPRIDNDPNYPPSR